MSKKHKQFWANRKIDWEKSYFNIDHPHRFYILRKLSKLKFDTLLEVGCGAGANLYLIAKHLKARVGGVDINKDATEVAKSKLPPSSIIEHGDITDMYFNSKSADVVLSDMALIYMDRKNMKKSMSEIARITRSHVLFLEFHSKSWFQRYFLWKNTGYYAQDYEKLLKKYGFYDIMIEKLDEEYWPGGYPQKKFAYLIYAKI